MDGRLSLWRRYQNLMFRVRDLGSILQNVSPEGYYQEDIDMFNEIRLNVEKALFDLISDTKDHVENNKVRRD